MEIVHRDLNPKNIFMNKNMEIKIGDFGISKQLNGEITSTQKIKGTFNYIAPEIIFEGKNNEKKSDIWSLGCIIYELFHLRIYNKDKYMNDIQKIDKDIYNYKWQDLLDSILQTDYNQRISIDRVLIKLEKININKEYKYIKNNIYS